MPGHLQHQVPNKSQSAPPGLDLDEEQCNALIQYVADLKRPVQRKATDADAETLKSGEAKFVSVGCAACHVANLGPVKGLYSDLLLHDMGRSLADVGSYGSFSPNSSDQSEDPLPLASSSAKPVPELTTEQLAKTVGALHQEWRTPPLWGCRDSAPYLHDGRAQTLEDAIVQHGGEGRESALQYFALSDAGRRELMAFLKSLVAPGLE